VRADGWLYWLVRLSKHLGRTPTELAEVLTARDLALYLAVEEIDAEEPEARLMPFEDGAAIFAARFAGDVLERAE